MTKTLTVEGMMCPHCENRVKTLLEGVSGVAKADVDHKAGTAVVTLTSDISASVLTDVIVNAGYKVTDIN